MAVLCSSGTASTTAHADSSTPPLAHVPTASASGAAETPGAHDTPGTITRLFVVGNSPGEPSIAKRSFVYGTYTLAIASTVTSAILYGRYRQQRSLNQKSISQATPRPCEDAASAQCSQLFAARHAERHLENWSAATAAAAGALVLAGALTAQLWPNTELAVSVGPSGAGSYVTVAF